MSRKFPILVLAAMVAALLVSAAPSFASAPVCGVVNHNVCVTVSNDGFSPIAPGAAVGQDTLEVRNSGGNTVNDVNVVLRGNTTFPGGANSVAWNFKQLKAGQFQRVSTLFNSLSAPGTIRNCADADWNENTRNGGRQDGLPDPGACEDTIVSVGAGLSIVPDATQGAALSLTSITIGTDPAGQQVGKATIPLLADFSGKATIVASAPTPDGYNCSNDKVRIQGQTYACRAGAFFGLNIQDQSGDSPFYPPGTPIVAEFTEPSGRFDASGIPLAVFHAAATGGVDGLATTLCGSIIPAAPNGCFASTPTVGGGFTHFVVKWLHNPRYH